jgi:hypothetical protein
MFGGEEEVSCLYKGQYLTKCQGDIHAKKQWGRLRYKTF